jgi:hypothetical protein
MRSYLEIARQALRQAQLPERPAPDAAYSELVCQAMQRIEKVCPPGALKWAREAHPALTEQIDVEIISRLNELWGDHAPLAEFQAALDELVRLHGNVGKLFANEP